MKGVSNKVSESLSEYIVNPDWINCKPEDVSLETSLGHISLQYPYMTSRMQSVVGPEMAETAGRNGILTMIPRSLRDEDKQEIIDANYRAKLNKGDVEFQDNPEFVYPNSSLEKVVNTIEKTGHSVMPVMDRFSHLKGVYIHDPDHPPQISPGDPITEAMIPLSENEEGIPYLINDDDSSKIKEILEGRDKKFVPIIDENMILQKLAFEQKFDTNYIGLAISTRSEERWKEEIDKWGRQVDTLCIDSSNACFDDALDILEYGKKTFPDIPFGVGNIVQGKYFDVFADHGADYIIGGMGVGSICQTGSKRGNGRGQMTVASELAEARDNYYNKGTGSYIPIVIDGGVKSIREMNVALALGDFIMMGGYFNQFFEAAGPKLDANGNFTDELELAQKVESWGEGHPRAGLIARFGIDNFREAYLQGQQGDIGERYGHVSISGSTVEGTVNHIDCRGRLKPGVEEDARYIKTNIANCGGWNPDSYRRSVINNNLLEKLSDASQGDMKPYGGKVVETK